MARIPADILRQPRHWHPAMRTRPAFSTSKQPATPGPARPAAGALHPRNRHQGRYDFALLLASDTRLQPFVRSTVQGAQSIDFADPAAVKALNRALLLAVHGIRDWDIPPGFLCPPVPGRADYLHYLADLLAASNGNRLPASGTASRIRVLDIGTGANCIYPLLGASEYGWHFTGSDINPAALANAQRIIDANRQLAANICLRLQTNSRAIFNGIIGKGEWFDLTLCNPPFHASQAEANAGTQRKWRNLGKTAGKPGKKQANKAANKTAGSVAGTARLNFGGQEAELWCEGGEKAFILQMIEESKGLAQHCFWFTSLVSSAANLPALYHGLKQAGVTASQTIAMSQGQKQSRMLAWTFLNPAQQAVWRQRQSA